MLISRGSLAGAPLATFPVAGGTFVLDTGPAAITIALNADGALTKPFIAIEADITAAFSVPSPPNPVLRRVGGAAIGLEASIDAVAVRRKVAAAPVSVELDPAAEALRRRPVSAAATIATSGAATAVRRAVLPPSFVVEFEITSALPGGPAPIIGRAQFDFEMSAILRHRVSVKAHAIIENDGECLLRFRYGIAANAQVEANGTADLFWNELGRSTRGLHRTSIPRNDRL